ncbi:hypothetical protein M8J77_000899 [Diaphorina citri]|nr:hypothetical protein M8J77_000899 [Diaphorina citri]
MLFSRKLYTIYIDWRRRKGRLEEKEEDEEEKEEKKTGGGGEVDVSWMRKRDLHILTTNIYTYTGDARFSVIHPQNSDEWNMKIDYAQKRDAGIYECQVNTEPKMNMAIMLNVDGK